jgi:hypothetical protein
MIRYRITASFFSLVSPAFLFSRPCFFSLVFFHAEKKFPEKNPADGNTSRQVFTFFPNGFLFFFPEDVFIFSFLPRHRIFYPGICRPCVSLKNGMRKFFSGAVLKRGCGELSVSFVKRIFSRPE